MPNEDQNTNKGGEKQPREKHSEEKASELDLLEIDKSEHSDEGLENINKSSHAYEKPEEIESTADIDRIEQRIEKSSQSHADKPKKSKAATSSQPVRRKSTAKLIAKILGIVLGITLLGIIIYGVRVWLAYNGFLDKVTGNEPESKEYSVIVLSSSNTNEIHELSRKSIGYLETDPKAGNAEQYLQTVVKHESSFYDDLGTLADVLTNKISHAIVIDSDWIQALEDESKDSMKDTRVIYTFTIELDGETVDVSNKDVTKEPFVVLLSGTDSRAGVKATARSDVNIVAVVNPKESKILLVSIPRDTYVQLHNTTGLKDKLTHAGVYGINMSKQTIEDFLGIKIDDTVKVSFDTVVKVVDQLDGITIDSDKEMTLKAEGKDKTCHYSVGKQAVDGDCALRFARERKSYETGDRHRGENQQQVISAIIDKLAHSKSYVLKLPTILDIAADSFETSLSKDNISSLIRMQLIDNPNWKTESIAIDGTGAMLPTYSMGANLPLYVMIPSEETVTNAQTKINEYLK